MLNTRAQRRAYEKALKKSDPVAYKRWKEEALERGKQVHQAHVERLRIVQDEFYEKKQRDIIKSMRDAGKSDEEIDAFISDWIQGIKVV